MLETGLEIDGIEDGSASVTEIGRTLEGFEAQLATLRQTFEKFDSTLGEMSKRVDAAAEGITKAADKTPTPEEIAQKESAARAAEERTVRSKMAGMVGGGVNFAAYEQQLKKTSEQINLINQAEANQVISHREAAEALSKLKSQYGKLQREAAAYALVGGGGLGRIAAGITARVHAAPGQVMGAAKSQVAGVGTGLMGLAMSTPLGHASGGLFGLMLHGQMNADRIKAETGEMVNIISAAGGKLTGSTVGFLGSFQQQAEHYFGISRQEVQGVLKTFVDAGVSVTDIMTKQKGSLGLVGHDIMTLTLAVDKHFEMAAGTSARHVVSLMSDYGQNVKEAGDLYTKMAFAGQQSGMGTQNFLNAVMTGAGALKQYGAGVEDVASTLLKLQERYEGMGMPKQLAGTQATAAMGQITQGLSSMSPTMQSVMGERMGMGTGMEARMNYRDGMQRIAKDGVGNSFASQNISELYKMAMESSGGDKTQARFMLEQQGFGFEGAKAIMEMGDHLDKGGKLTDLSIKKQQELRDAFKTEGEKQSDIAKNQHTIMQGMAQVGEGLLQIVSNFVAIGIVFFKTMPALFFGTDAEKKATIDVMKGFYDDIGKGANKMFEGSKGVGAGVYGLMKPIIEPLNNAIGWNPYGVNNNVQTFRIGQGGAKAEKDMLASNGGLAASRGLGVISDKLASSGHDTLARGADDARIITEGVEVGLSRLGSTVASMFGYEDVVKNARERGMAGAEQQIAQEKATTAAAAKARAAEGRGGGKGSGGSVKLTVQPAHVDRSSQGTMNPGR